MRLSAVLLAGGKSTRMGCNKALLEIDGQPLWRRQLEMLRSLTIKEIFLAGGSFDCDVETIADDIQGAGPLGGIAAALRRTKTEQLLVLAVDLPKMTAAFLQTLIDRCLLKVGVVPQRSDRFEPLAAIYPREMCTLAQEALAAGDFSLQNFVRAGAREGFVRIYEVNADEASLFANLNTPADLATL